MLSYLLYEEQPKGRLQQVAFSFLHDILDASIAVGLMHAVALHLLLPAFYYF